MHFNKSSFQKWFHLTPRALFSKLMRQHVRNMNEFFWADGGTGANNMPNVQPANVQDNHKLHNLIWKST